MAFVLWFFGILLTAALISGATLEAIRKVPESMIFQLPVSREMKGKIFSSKAGAMERADKVWKLYLPALAIGLIGYIFLVIFLCLG